MKMLHLFNNIWLEEENRELEEQLKKSQETIEKMERDKGESNAKLKESEAKLAQDKAESDAQINELRNLIDSLQQASTSNTLTQESNNARLFKH